MQPKIATAAALVLILASCSTENPAPHNSNFQSGESVVLIGNEPARVAFAPATSPAANVRSTYLDDLTNTIHYIAGRDYTFDYQAGAIRRTPSSHIPDFSTNILFGKEDFDHSKFPGYGNGQFFVFIDYAAEEKPAWPTQVSQAKFLPRTRKKLESGQKLTLVAFGDSITAGGEATRSELIYWQRWADSLHAKYPRSEIKAINSATGGDTTVNGLARLDEKVVKQKPDLVLIAFGMNDHNLPGIGVPLNAFAANLKTMINRIHQNTDAEVILVSTFPPNPKWHFGSQSMEQYAQATEQVAREKNCAYADVFDNWQAVVTCKKTEDLLGNNINHPNDYGHSIYYQVLQRIGL